MFKNRILMLLIIVLVAITLIIAAVYFFLIYGKSHNKDGAKTPQITADERSALSYPVKDILTNLKNNDKYIKISFALEMNNKKGLEEIKKLDFLVKNDIIETLNDLGPEQIQGSKGHDYLTSILINKINPILSKGKITRIYITDFVLQ